jgi:hypothetical protein
MLDGAIIVGAMSRAELDRSAKEGLESLLTSNLWLLLALVPVLLGVYV